MSFNMTTMTMGLLVVAAAAAAALLSMLVTTTTTTTIPTAVYAQIILNNTNSSSSGSIVNNNNTTTNSSSLELQGALAPDRIEALSAQDPEFAAFQEMYGMYLGYAVPPEKNNATIPYDQCVRSMQQSVDKWCNLSTYEKDKCETASTELGLLTAGYELRNIFSGPP